MTYTPGEKKPNVKCQWCGRSMSPGRAGTRRFCSNACKQAFYRKKKAGDGVMPISVTKP